MTESPRLLPLFGLLPALLLLAFLGGGVPVPTSAQGTTEDLELAERIDVVEIQIEALVTDRDGRTVDGLGRADFDVRVAGEPAEVLAVRRVAHSKSSRGAGDGAGGEPDAARDSLRLVLFLDLVHSNPATNARYLGQTLEFLKDELRRSDRVMVASYDGDVSVNLPFTDDLGQVRRTLMGLLNHASTGMSARTEQSEIDLIRQLKVGTNEDICLFADIYAVGFAEKAHTEIESAIAALEDFVDTLVGLPGRKALVHLSSGLPLVAGKGAMDYVIELCGGFEGTAGGVDGAIDFTSADDSVHADADILRMALLRFDTTPEWQRLAARANRNNVSFYPIHTGGLSDATFGGAESHDRTTSTGTSVARGMNQQDALSLIATETGGRAILNQNDASDGLGRMAADLRDFYLLSVRGTGGEPGDILDLKVTVDRPGTRVRHRRSLHVQDRHEAVADRVLAMALHAGNTDDGAARDNSMGLSVELAGQGPAAADLRSVRLQLRVPLSSLTLLPAGPEAPNTADETNTAFSGRFTVFLAATDREGRTTPVRTSTVPVRVEAGDEGTEIYTFEVEMEMRRGEHVVGFGVLDELGGETSFLRMTVEG